MSKLSMIYFEGKKKRIIAEKKTSVFDILLTSCLAFDSVMTVHQESHPRIFLQRSKVSYDFCEAHRIMFCSVYRLISKVVETASLERSGRARGSTFVNRLRTK